MSAKKFSELSRELSKTAILTGADFDRESVLAFCEELANYDLADIVNALGRVRKECKGRFAVADIINRINLGYEGPEQAWSRCPRSERDSVVWTEAHQRAYVAAAPLMNDLVAARMTFRETYNREVDHARTEGRKARWFLSRGWDKAGQVQALEDAVIGGLLPASSAATLLPDEVFSDINGKLIRFEQLNRGSGEVGKVIARIMPEKAKGAA